MSKTKHQSYKERFKKLVQCWQKCIEVCGDFVENGCAALKIIDVGIFLFLFH
jgi:hypothetical protein